MYHPYRNGHPCSFVFTIGTNLSQTISFALDYVVTMSSPVLFQRPIRKVHHALHLVAVAAWTKMSWALLLKATMKIIGRSLKVIECEDDCTLRLHWTEEDRSGASQASEGVHELASDNYNQEAQHGARTGRKRNREK